MTTNPTDLEALAAAIREAMLEHTDEMIDCDEVAAVALRTIAQDAEPVADAAVVTDGELLPCPLCGGEARHVKPFFHLGNLCGDYVACNVCGCRNYRPHKVGDPDAITAWNTRPLPTDSASERSDEATVDWQTTAEVQRAAANRYAAQVAALREALEAHQAYATIINGHVVSKSGPHDDAVFLKGAAALDVKGEDI